MPEVDSMECVEDWKQVVGFEGIYSISNRGRLRREVTSSNSKAGFILKPLVRKSGYCVYTIWHRGRMFSPLVHRLVADAFLENPESKPQVNHRDGDCGNNVLENLEWCTALENVRHAMEVLGWDPKGGSNQPFGDGHYKSRLTQVQVDDIRARARAGRVNQSAIGREFGVNKRTIHSLLKGISWKRSFRVA